MSKLSIKQKASFYKNESDLQQQCIRAFRLIYSAYAMRLWAVPNGGLRNKVTARRLKAEGALSGVWDLFLSVPVAGSGGLFIEMKNGYNTLTDSQKAFKEANTGYSYAVCYSVDEFLQAVEKYLSQ